VIYLEVKAVNVLVSAIQPLPGVLVLTRIELIFLLVAAVFWI